MHLVSHLRQGGVALGTWINTASPIVAELVAGCGWDFLTIDAEHSAVDLAATQVLMQAVRSGNPACAPLVRTPDANYGANKRYMDAGAEGLIVPLVNTVDDARQVVDAVKYPPTGKRGLGFCRDNDYGRTIQSRVAEANDDSFVGIQVEHVEAVERIDEILAVPGIDAAFIGPYDLSASMGLAGQLDHERVLEAQNTVLAACRKHGVVSGIHIIRPEPNEARRAIEAGYRFIAYSLDITVLNTVYMEGLNALREFLAASPGGFNRETTT